MHECKPKWAAYDNQMRGGYGPAVEYCREESDGTLWVGNMEYETRVNYCPFCGYKAAKQVPNIAVTGAPRTGQGEAKDG